MWGEPKDKTPLMTEIPRHRKGSQRKTPRKSKHKHEYKRVILFVQYGRKAYQRYFTRGGQCVICGKVTNDAMASGWSGNEKWMFGVNEAQIIAKYPEVKIVDIGRC